MSSKLILSMLCGLCLVGRFTFLVISYNICEQLKLFGFWVAKFMGFCRICCDWWSCHSVVLFSLIRWGTGGEILCIMMNDLLCNFLFYEHD